MGVCADWEIIHAAPGVCRASGVLPPSVPTSLLFLPRPPGPPAPERVPLPRRWWRGSKGLPLPGSPRLTTGPAHTCFPAGPRRPGPHTVFVLCHPPERPQTCGLFSPAWIPSSTPDCSPRPIRVLSSTRAPMVTLVPRRGLRHGLEVEREQAWWPGCWPAEGAGHSSARRQLGRDTGSHGGLGSHSMSSWQMPCGAAPHRSLHAAPSFTPLAGLQDAWRRQSRQGRAELSVREAEP